MDYTKLSKEELISEIKKLKTYGLVWDKEREPEEVVENCKEKLPILEIVKDKSIETEDSIPNIIIEGDNYHALTCLNYTHKEKIDVIYIDPPYNTGAQDWKYNNKYVDKEDTYRHSKWLNMMSKRLELAKNVLKEDGVLICAIDNYEYANLYLLLVRTFGEECHLGTVCVRNNPSGRTSNRKILLQHDYHIIFGKSLQSSLIKQYVPIEQKSHKYEEDKNGPYEKRNLRRGRKRRERPSRFYPIFFNPATKKLSVDSCDSLPIKILPIDSSKQECTWDRSKEDISSLYDKQEIWVEKKENSEYQIYFKFRPSLEGELPKSLWTESKYSSRESGKVLLNSILKNNNFDYPKSLYTIIDTLKATSQKDSTILDFFAGSGTTGHATLQLNKEDGGNRRFILCTNNENNNGTGQGGIAETVTYPRIKKVIEGYNKNGDGDWIEGLGSNLKYLKCSFAKDYIDNKNHKKGQIDIDEILNAKIINDDLRIKLTRQAGYLIALSEDTLEEIKLEDYYQIFTNYKKDKLVSIYFSRNLEKLKSLCELIKNSNDSSLYAMNLYSLPTDYEDSNITIKDIPKPILEIYKSIGLINDI